MNTPQDQHAWLIGASSGMGLEVGRLLAAQGWAVTLSARAEERLARAADEIGGDHRVLDVTEPATVAGVAAELFAARPPTLVMVNAFFADPSEFGAGELVAMFHTYFLGSAEGLLFDVPDDDYDTALFARLNAVNYLGPVNVLGAVLPLMREHGGGEILLNASAAGLRGLPRSAPYSAPKAATIHLAEALRPEAARWGIALRVINPGFVRSPLTDKNQFTMPGLMDADAAARRIVAGIGGKGFEISFPRRLLWPLKLLRCLPYGLYFRLVERAVLRS